MIKKLQMHLDNLPLLRKVMRSLTLSLKRRKNWGKLGTFVVLLQNLIHCFKQSYTGSLIEYNLHFPSYNLAPVA